MWWFGFLLTTRRRWGPMTRIREGNIEPSKGGRDKENCFSIKYFMEIKFRYMRRRKFGDTAAESEVRWISWGGVEVRLQVGPNVMLLLFLWPMHIHQRRRWRRRQLIKYLNMLCTLFYTRSIGIGICWSHWWWMGGQRDQRNIIFILLLNTINRQDVVVSCPSVIVRAGHL